METSMLLLRPEDISTMKSLSETNGIKVSDFNGKITAVEVEYQSVLNFIEPVFLADEKWLSDCYKVFCYYHKNKDDFKLAKCVKATGVTLHFVTIIFDKYLKK